MKKYLIFLILLLLVGCSNGEVASTDSSTKSKTNTQNSASVQDNATNQEKGQKQETDKHQATGQKQEEKGQSEINQKDINEYLGFLFLFTNSDFNRDYFYPYIEYTQKIITDSRNRNDYIGKVDTIRAQIHSLAKQIYDYEVPDINGIKDIHEDLKYNLQKMEMNLDRLKNVAIYNNSLRQWNDYLKDVANSREKVGDLALKISSLADNLSESNNTNIQQNNNNQEKTVGNQINEEEAKKLVENLNPNGFSVTTNSFTDYKVANWGSEQRDNSDFFVFKVYEDQPDHVVTHGWFYVEKETGLVYELDVAQDVLNPVTTDGQD